jgi:hypothetical protein
MDNRNSNTRLTLRAESGALERTESGSLLECLPLMAALYALARGVMRYVGVVDAPIEGMAGAYMVSTDIPRDVTAGQIECLAAHLELAIGKLEQNAQRSEPASAKELGIYPAVVEILAALQGVYGHATRVTLQLDQALHELPHPPLDALAALPPQRKPIAASGPITGVADDDGHGTRVEISKGAALVAVVGLTVQAALQHWSSGFHIEGTIERIGRALVLREPKFFESPSGSQASLPL